MKFTPIYLPKSVKDLLAEQHKRMSSNLPSQTSSLSNQKEVASPLTSHKLTNDMHQINSQLDVNAAENSRLLPVTKAIKQEFHDLQHRQSSDATRDELREEDKTLSCKNENDSDILMQKPSPNSWTPAQSNQPIVSLHIKDEKADQVIPKHEPDSLNLIQSPASQSDKHYSTRPEKAVEKLQPRRNPEIEGCSSKSLVNVSENFLIIPKEDSHPNSLQPRQSLEARNHELASTDDKFTPVKSENVSENLISISSSSFGVPVTQHDPENFQFSASFVKVEKLQPRRNPDPLIQGSLSDAESTPSRVPEKGLADGYNWRKYGQKLVKGNTFIRSYYKCTYLNCQAKKQVERSHDGCKTDVNYLGTHHHPTPQHSPQVNSPFQVQMLDIPVVSATKTDAEPIIEHGGVSQPMAPTETLLELTAAGGADGVIEAVSCSNNDNNDNNDKDAKRQKREITSADDNVVNKPNSDLRNVVQTLSEVDIVNDGYRWRKYGQKLVKGNPNPRSYYRCSNAGCQVKKHVERASHDPKLVITTYEGQHDHDMPSCRNVSQSAASGDANIMTTNAESRPKPEENNPVALDMVVHVSSN